VHGRTKEHNRQTGQHHPPRTGVPREHRQRGGDERGIQQQDREQLPVPRGRHHMQDVVEDRLAGGHHIEKRRSRMIKALLGVVTCQQVKVLGPKDRDRVGGEVRVFVDLGRKEIGVPHQQDRGEHEKGAQPGRGAEGQSAGSGPESGYGRPPRPAPRAQPRRCAITSRLPRRLPVDGRDLHNLSPSDCPGDGLASQLSTCRPPRSRSGPVPRVCRPGHRPAVTIRCQPTARPSGRRSPSGVFVVSGPKP